MKLHDVATRRGAGALLIIASVALGACAGARPAGTGGAGHPAADDPVVLRVNGEEFTRSALERVNPQQFATGVTHGKMLRQAYLQRFIAFRLAVQEARRRGLEGSGIVGKRFDEYLDARCAEALVADLKIVEEQPGSFADDDLAADLVGDQRRAQIRARMRERGLTVSPRSADGGRLLDALAAGDDAAVIAEAGGERVTVGELRELCLQKGLTSPTEGDAARALDELALYRDIVAAARAEGRKEEEAKSEAAFVHREKLLEAVLGEALVPPGSLSAAAVAEFFAANTARYQRVEAVRLRKMILSESDVRGVYKQLRDGGNFAALAKQYSLDAATAAAGGDLGWVAPGTPGIPAPVFALREGQFTRLDTLPERRFAIYGVDERRVATPALEAIERQVRADAEMAARTGALRDLVAELQANADIWMSEELQK